MGRDRQLPLLFARIHPHHGTPYVATLATAAVSLAVALRMRERLDDLALFINFGALSGFLMLHLSVLAYFAFQRRSRAWGAHWLVPLCGMAVVLAVFCGMSALAVKLGLAWLALGIVYGLALRSKRRGQWQVPP
jgi:amino acid transporter